ncbi:two component transcriptional regulator, LuxR family [Thermoactinomyces sp. DSM 45891]|nr:two component transcriptional regulator, LuxR family [Thermoactinomyces sp. DSM 45891]
MDIHQGSEVNVLIESPFLHQRNAHFSEPSNISPIRILVADSSDIYLNRYKNLFSYYPELQIVASCIDGSEVAHVCETLIPQVVVMDLYLPRMDAVEVTHYINRVTPQTKVLILTDQADQYAVEAIRNGATGYLLKEIEPKQLIEALKVVVCGGTYIHPVLVSKMASELRRLSRQEGAFSRIHTSYHTVNWQEILTNREMEVLRLLSQGKNNRAVGEHLFISEKTVKNHVSKILYKLDVQDRTQAVLLAIKYGWVQLI